MTGKLDQLKAALRSGGHTLVAYSGGVDSVFLAKVAHDTLGDEALAVIADSPSLPRRELQEALEIAEQFGFPVRVIKTQEMGDANYTSNPSNRCYFCKSELFESLAEITKSRKVADDHLWRECQRCGGLSTRRGGGEGISGARAFERSRVDEGGDSRVVGGDGFADGGQARRWRVCRRGFRTGSR